MMSRIQNIGRSLGELIFGRKETKNIYSEAATSGDDMGNKKRLLKELLAQGEINEAENRLFEWDFNNEANALRLGIWFYQTLAKIPPEDLAKADFTVEEIHSGFLELFAKHELNSIQELEKLQ
jgi:hypothetical protein